MSIQTIARILDRKGHRSLANQLRVIGKLDWKFGSWDGKDHFWPETNEWSITDSGKRSKFDEFDSVTYGYYDGDSLLGFVDFNALNLNRGYVKPGKTGTWEMSAGGKTTRGTIKDFNEVPKVLKKLAPKVKAAVNDAKKRIANIPLPEGWELTGDDLTMMSWDKNEIGGELSEYQKVESYSTTAVLWSAENLITGEETKLELRFSDYGGMSSHGDDIISYEVKVKTTKDVQVAIGKFDKKVTQWVVKERRELKKATRD